MAGLVLPWLDSMYVGGSLVVVGLGGVVVVLDLVLDRRAAAAVEDGPGRELSREEVAVLAGGTMRLGLVAVLGLVERGEVSLTRTGRLGATEVRTSSESTFETAAFSVIRRVRTADLHDVQEELRQRDQTHQLLRGLVDARLVRPHGMTRAGASSGQASWLDSMGVWLWFVVLAIGPFVVLSLLAGDDPDRSWESDPIAFVPFGAGLVLVACWVRLGRLRTSAGSAALRSVPAGPDELSAVARAGHRHVRDRATRRALRQSLAPRYTSGGGG